MVLHRVSVWRGDIGAFPAKGRVVISGPDYSYSADVELDHQGRLVAARDIEEGEIVSIPSHMFGALRPGDFEGNILRTTVSHDHWMRLFRS